MKLSPADLESLVHRSLRELPGPAAPPGWEARVLAEIHRRRALPWWRRSFPGWPRAVRAAFLLLSAAAAAGLAAGLMRFRPEAGAARLIGKAAVWGQAWQLGATLLRQGGEAALAVVRSLPSPYLYGAIALAAGGFAAIVLLGAAAYRALALRPSA